eukprot:4271284-Alexandrium_andersonii.AAC.1
MSLPRAACLSGIVMGSRGLAHERFVCLLAPLEEATTDHLTCQPPSGNMPTHTQRSVVVREQGVQGESDGH